MKTLVRIVAFTAFLVTSVIGLTGAPVHAQADQSGVIDGQITNGTAGVASPANLEVVVHVLQNRAKTGERRVLTDTAGRFRVDGLATGPEMLYFPIVQYGGVPYFPAQPISFQSPAPAPVPVEITVFEPTPTGDALAFDRINMLLMNVTPSAMMVMEMGAVVNGADRTFAADAQVTGSARTLRFALPTGAIQITGQAGLPQDTLESTADGFATSDPVRPGRREIAYSYQLPYDASTVEFSRSFAYPVSTFTLYLPDDSIQAIGPGLTPLGTAELGGRTFRLFAVQNVAPGTVVRFRLSGLPAPFFARPRDLGLAVAGTASVILALLLALSIRRRSLAAAATSPAAAPSGGGFGALPAVPAPERLALLRSVAELDERFESGEVEEATYRSERETYKAQLVAMSRTTAGA
jgi:hypothetical protein